MGARFYSPTFSIFTSVDPLSAYRSWISPYNYVQNNPVMRQDPTGMLDLGGGGPVKEGKIILGSEGECLKLPGGQQGQPRELAYVIQDGVMSGSSEGSTIVHRISAETLREKMNHVEAVVLHRTVSSTAESAIRTTKRHKGKTGFHIVVDKNGTVTQINNLKNRANHVGNQKGTVGNYNSIGIEVVGMPVDEDGKPTVIDNEIVGWETLTCEQIENTAQVVASILIEYDLSFEDIFPHEDVSWKTPGEGQVVIDAIMSRVGDLMQSHFQLKSEAEGFKTHKNSEQDQKSINY